MAVIEYRAIASKAVHKGDELHVIDAVEGGHTVRTIYGKAARATLRKAMDEADEAERDD